MKQLVIKWLLRGALCILLIVAATGLGAWIWLQGSLPQTSGELKLAGLARPVEVLRDPDGLVTLRAESEADAYRALGFVHAQERLWQMDFMRRLGAGRLSELLGDATLSTDRFIRTLGLHRQAEAQFQDLAPEVRASLTAYSAGVNAFLESRSGPLPLEFQILRYSPEPWKPSDSLAWGRIMAMLLSNNRRMELLRGKLLQYLAPEQVAFLWPANPGDAPTTLAKATEDLPAAPRLRALLDGLPEDLRPQSASNAWAVPGTETRSGKPLLANDPHLGLTAPGHWFLVRLELPELTLAGVTAPGVPFHVIGHNDRIAWGFTTTHSDTQDLFVERLTEDGRGYETPEGPSPFETRREIIGVKGQDAVELEVRSTRHGPVISDVFSDESDRPAEGTVLALAWTALMERDRTPGALYALNRAKDWPQFREALRDFHSPQQNIFYADVDGNIGFIAPGRVPLRKAGNGMAPVEGWSGTYDWDGLIAFEDLPQALNPAQGAIVSGNNRVVPEGYPHFLAGNWPPPQRARRIEQLLAQSEAASPDSAAAIQLDSVSLDAKDLLPRLLEPAPNTEAASQAKDLLAAWDGSMDRSRPEPAIYAAWAIALTRRFFADELGADFQDFSRPDARRLNAVLSADPSWCDDTSTAAVETCDQQIAAALDDALKDLDDRLGGPIQDWRWGALHRAELAHPILGRVPLVRDVFGFGVETDGGDETVNRGVFSLAPGQRFSHVAGASLRIVFDLADLDATRAITATGQSGNPLSPHYGSLARRWRDGAFLRLKNDSPETSERLILMPQ